MHIDGGLAYDSRLEEYDLQTLKTKTGLNKGGTATIGLPPRHPSYNSFAAYKSIVEIRRDGKLKFRGRPLPHSDDFLNQRTVICEGEFCFLRDAQHRPYIYQDSPANIFTQVLGVYNSQAEPERQFKVGRVTVTDANNYIRLESENPENTMTTVNKLLERCGGYVTFTTDTSDGKRVIHWLAELGYRSSQVIEFGENLLDFTRDNSANEEIATALLPYGAKDEETGLRLTIESVNNGLDYIVDEETRQLRGFILATKTWDDVTQPSNLLSKAREELLARRNIITSLRLTALDRSYIDNNLDSYEVGDLIPVYSKPHNLDEDFLLTEKEEDFLDPKNGNIVLGKDKRSLTGANADSEAKRQDELNKVKEEIKTNYVANIDKVVQTTEQTLASLIDQTSEALRLMVSAEYATNDQLTEAVNTQMTQLADQFLFEFERLEAGASEDGAEARQKFNEIYSYIRFKDGAIQLGNSESAITLAIENDRISFKKNGSEFGWWDGEDFHTGNIVVEVNERAQFGNFAFVPRSNGSLSFLKVK